MNDAPPRVLFVDDEPHVLEAIQRNLGMDLDVSTATSGREALDAIAKSAPFSVICSDMRMPQMDGASFLAAAKVASPGSIRLLLTGQTEIDAAVRAINDGEIFRFLVKPCPAPKLRAIVDAAVEQHRLQHAEREVLEKTLNATIRLLAEVLGLVSPIAFSRAERIGRMAAHVAARLSLRDRWKIEAAASLMSLGTVALPPALVDRWLAGGGLSPEERQSIKAHPETAAKLLRPIPRLGDVAEIVRRQADPIGEPADGVEHAVLVLQVVSAIDADLGRGEALAAAIAKARRNGGAARLAALDALASFHPPAADAQLRAVTLKELAPHMVPIEDLCAASGVVLVPAGAELTVLSIERVRRFASTIGVVEPIRVRVAAR